MTYLHGAEVARYLEALTAEIEGLKHPNISLLKQGDEFTF